MKSKEIIKSLKEIKALCNNTHSCSDCPFGFEGGCDLQAMLPCNWEINEKVISEMLKNN